MVLFTTNINVYGPLVPFFIPIIMYINIHNYMSIAFFTLRLSKGGRDQSLYNLIVLRVHYVCVLQMPPYYFSFLVYAHT